ncbi:MAG: protein kinase [Polyangiaceae bacterium]
MGQSTAERGSREWITGSIVGGRFRILERVAAGGMGTVFKAADLATNGVVALKLVRSFDSSEARERFQQEAEILGELRHPRVVGFVASGSIGESGAYLALEWLDGVDLLAKLGAGALALREATGVVGALADALAAAHARGIVHRDIKPANVILRGGDVTQPVLIDFGIAALATARQTITLAGMTVGTPGYMAPEQIRGERAADARVDVYGLGCLLFHLVAGHPPFVGPTPMSVVAEVLLSEAPRLSSRACGVPPELDALAASMLARDPARRPAAVRAVADELARIGASFAQRVRADHRSVSGEERRMAVIVAAAAPTTPASKSSTVRMRGVFLPSFAARFGAAFHHAGAGAALLVFTSGESLSELGARAATLALEAIEADPALALGLVVGPSSATGRPDGVLVERACSLAANPGVALADEVARGVLRDRFVFARAGSEIRLMRARPVGDTPSPYLPFVGRDHELAALQKTVAASRARREVRAALVVAEPGAGKSRLLRELYVELEGEDAPPAVVDATAEILRKDAPLSLVGQLVRRALVVVPGIPVEEQTALLGAALAHLVPPSERPRVTAFVAMLADLPLPADAPTFEVAAARRDPQLLEDRLGAAFGQVLDAMADRAGGLVLLVDDLQWADDPSIRLITKYLRRARGRAVSIVGFARPEIDERHAGIFHDVSFDRVQLAAIPRRASEALVRAVLGDSAPAEALERLVAQGEGNPLFLQELATAALEQRVTLAAAPSSVLASLEARILRLDPEARRILRAASVFGETFWRGGVAHLAADATELDTWLIALVEQDLVSMRRTTRFAGELELTFRHGLLRDAAYAMLTPEDRLRGHRLAAAWLASMGEADHAVLARHLEEAGDVTLAAVEWGRAAFSAYHRNDATRAIAWAEHALARGVTGERRAELLALVTEAAAWVGDIERAAIAGAEAVATFAQGSQRWADVAAAYAQALARRDDPEVLGVVVRIIEALRADPNLRVPVRLLPAFLPICYRKGASSLGEEAMRLIGDAALRDYPGDPGVLAYVLRARSWQAMFAGDIGACVGFDTEALARCQEAGDVRQACLSRMDVGYDLMSLGAYARAVAVLRDALLEAEALSLDGLIRLIEHNLAFALVRDGQADAGIALQRSCLERAMRDHDLIGEAFCRRYLGIALLERGELDAAQAEFELSMTLEETTSTRWDNLAKLALIALARGDLPRAAALADEAVRGANAHANAEEGALAIPLAAIEVGLARGADVTHELAALAERLNAAAARISDPTLRTTYLDNIPEHRRVRELSDELAMPVTIRRPPTRPRDPSSGAV